MVELVELIAQSRATKDYERLAQFAPYAKLLGIAFGEEADGSLLYRLEYKPENIGNTLLPALHGGVIAGFMEHAATLEILWNRETISLPKIIDFSIDYLRPGRPEVLFAQCTLIRQGLRVANVAVSAWQGSPERTVATARMHFLLSRPGSESPT
jgi:uncharacterized protein (TIGR00369 family)